MSIPDILRSLTYGGRDQLSRRVFRPLHAVYRGLRPESRAAYLHFRAGLRFRAQAQNWSDAQRRDWLLQRLRATVQHAATTTPFYGEWFRSVGFDPRADFTFDDYARLPVLEREVLQQAGEAVISHAVPRALLREDATGGSTGTPTRVWKGPEERGWGESGTEHFMRRIGLPAGSRIALLWGHHLDPTARGSLRERLEDVVQNTRWFDCFRLDDDQLLRYHADLEEWRPRAMIAYAGALAALAQAVQGRDARPGYPTRAFVTGAEKLHPHQRHVIETVYGRPVHERYGSRDVGLMGFQLDPTRSHDFTVDWAKLLVEPETTGGVAPVVVTKLRADGMPLLRYRVGDVARFPSDARPGHPAFTLHEVLGRDMDRLWLADGRWMHPVGLPHLMKDYPVRGWQVHQASDLAIEIRVVPGPDYTSESGVAIVRTLSANVPGVPISLRLVDEIPRTRANKWRPVISEVGRPSQTLPVP